MNDLKTKVQELLKKVQDTDGYYCGYDWYGWSDLKQFIEMNFYYISMYVYGSANTKNVNEIKAILIGNE